MSGNVPQRALYTPQGIMGPIQPHPGMGGPRGVVPHQQQQYPRAMGMQQPAMMPQPPASPSRRLILQMGLPGMSQAPPSPGQPLGAQQRAPVGMPGAGQGMGGMYMSQQQPQQQPPQQQQPPSQQQQQQQAQQQQQQQQHAFGQSRLPMSSAVSSGYPSRAPPGITSQQQPFPPSADDDLDFSGFPGLSGMSGPFGNTTFAAASKKPAAKFNDFSMMQDDFPALPGAKSAKSPDSPADLLPGSAPLSPGGSHISNFSARSFASNGSFPSLGAGREDDLLSFGLMGLQDVIKMTDADLSMLALGTDLTTLGMNLSSSEPLYPLFVSPWADGPLRAKEPNYQLPQCYNVKPTLSPALFNNLSEETLFYIFYAMPQDSLQLYAALCLFQREWRYHKEHKIWLCRAPGIEPVQKTATFERGTFVCFDPQTWKKETKEMHLQYDALEDRKQMLAPS